MTLVAMLQGRQRPRGSSEGSTNLIIYLQICNSNDTAVDAVRLAMKRLRCLHRLTCNFKEISKQDFLW